MGPTGRASAVSLPDGLAQPRAGRATTSPGRGRKGEARSRHTGGVGLNPFRQHRRSPADYLMVAGAVVVCLALVLWAFFG